MERGTISVKVLYNTEATATGGREGWVESADGHLNMHLTLPKELGGPGGGGTNPEQLFAAGYAACFDNAMILVGRRMRRSTSGSRVTARVGLGVLEAGRFGMEVELLVTLPELDQAEAEELLAATHKVCPFSNAVVGNIDVKLTVVPPSEVL
jgi:lipoyl-dependent peroxiredoxin